MTPELPVGYSVRYRHHRVAVDNDLRLLGPKGGETEARVYGPDDSLVAIGVAVCHPSDNFSRRLGRSIALGRALKQLFRKGAVLATDPRPEIWDQHRGYLRCDRIMVGEGTDTYDPTCDLPAGHKGVCQSTAAISQNRLEWICSGCGATEGRYDGGDACERCVLESFAEAG